MKAITEKLHNKALEAFKPVIEQMAAEGCSHDQIVKAYEGYLRQKTNHYYNQSDLKSFKQCFNIEDLKNADSKAESIFYEMLQGSKIKFDFQYTIGPYRADYLVEGFLVVEIDGPQHDKDHDEKRDNYLRKMGYKIIRIPLWALVSCPEAAIDEIKGATNEHKTAPINLGAMIDGIGKRI
jgi:very-short-patch-repair endonuclease